MDDESCRSPRSTQALRQSPCPDLRETETQPQALTKRTADIAGVRGDDRDPAVFTLNPVLHGYEPAQPDRFLRSPPTATEREYERLIRCDRRDPRRNARLVKKLNVRKP